MRIKKHIAIAVSTLLLSVGAATAQVKLNTSSDTTAPTAPAQVEATSAPSANQQQDELEKLRQENAIRDRVQSEVDRAFNRATNLFNILLFILALFPIMTAVGFWLLRRSMTNQIASDTKNLLNQFRHRMEKQLAAEVTAELKGQTEALKLEISSIRSDTVSQITSLISEAQTVLEELRQQRDFIEQEINRLRYENYYQNQSLVEQEIEPLNNEAISQMLDFAADDPFELADNYEKSEVPSEVFDASDYLQQGNTLFEEGRYVEASNAFSEAIKLDRNFAEARYQNARCYGIQGRVNLAVGNLQWAIDIDPNYQEMAKADFAFDAIRQDGRFKKMMENSSL